MPAHPIAAAALVAGLGLSLASLPAGATPDCGPGAAAGGPARVAVGAAPPPRLPPERQPPIPGYGYIWTPGYWGWNAAINDYYWISGIWALPPRVGLLWTPAWWGWNNGVYVFAPGFWGPTVGFYGGINYGWGYGGYGYGGGYWRGNTFYYNRTVNNFGRLRVNAVYARAVPVNRAAGRLAFNGGPGGVKARATPQEAAAARGPHLAATAGQVAHAQKASFDPAGRAAHAGWRPDGSGAGHEMHGGLHETAHGSGHAGAHADAASGHAARHGDHRSQARRASPGDHGSGGGGRPPAASHAPQAGRGAGPAAHGGGAPHGGGRNKGRPERG